MDPDGEEKRKVEEDAGKEEGKQHSSDSSGRGDPLITKSEMKSEMRSMILELVEMGIIGSRPHELKLELMPNEVKLEGSKNYLSWARRALSGRRMC
jgi:hypothetical protein